MKQALHAASTSAKFSFGLGITTVFISNMDDVIYANFRKNVILPFQMVSIKGSRGEINVQDVKSLSSGAGNFMKDLKPHGLAPANAKELILKDADYSTPQDHYFGYVNRNKGALDQGASMGEVNAELYNEELKVIQDLYGDQEGRAASIERHINYLSEKRKTLTMTQIYENLTPTEIADIENNWGTSLENIKELAAKHDAKVAEDAILPEDKRTKKGTQMLDQININQIMEMSVSERKIVEFQPEDAFTMKADQIVKIGAKPKKKRK